MAYTLTKADLLDLKRWNTPTIYNGWERVTKHDRLLGRFNREPVQDMMPQMGIMVGYAATVIVQPGNAIHQQNNPNAQREYMQYLATFPGPIIAVVQDVDDNILGSFWGEVNANIHIALGCVGTITDGAARDIDEMTNAGMKVLCKQLCVGHAYSTPVKWGSEIEVFGTTIKSGDLIHADKHGFLAIDAEDTPHLLDAVRFMDHNENQNLLSCSKSFHGKNKASFIAEYTQHVERFQSNAKEYFDSLKA